MFKDALTVQVARQEFLAKGQVGQGQVAKEIERSWQRCLANGLDAESAQSYMLSKHEFGQRIEMNHLLLSHARPEMDTLNEQIAHTRSIVILTDAEGVILHSLGDSSFMTEAQRVALGPGSSWNERHRGTNAIGTALIEQSPMTVHGAEHYVAKHHVLSCSAVPIYGVQNDLIGTLDVSNDYLLPQQHTLALVKMAAQMIENRLFRASHKSAYSLHFHARPEFIGTLWEGIAMFADDGRLLATNRSGQFQLNINLNNSNIYFDDLFEQTLRSLEGRAAGVDQVVLPLRLSNGARIYARLQINNVSGSQAQSISMQKPAKRACAASLDMLNSGDRQINLAVSQIKMVLNQDIPILIQGETGVGKELFARAIHEASDRHDGPLVAVNCASLPEGLIESELFGYEEGAFTGARRKGNTGKVAQADCGTLFLDEIGDMPLALQARLLRVLQDRSVTPLGSNKASHVDFALVCATNQKLRDKVERGEFRSDLYYRINGLSVTLPALRKRNDLEALIKIILQTENAVDAVISNEVMMIFKQHPWPGNVRQLHNVVRTALALSMYGTIEMAHLPQDFLDELQDEGTIQPASNNTCLESLTMEAILTALQRNQGNISAAARDLGLSRNTLYRKLKPLG